MPHQIKKLFLLLLCVFLFLPAAVSAVEIDHLVVFGDSLSDRGFTQEGGFNRYSNGAVWPEYLAKSLCRDCLKDCAWGGARTDYGNYNGFNWSGVLWQIEQFKFDADLNKTLFIIWAGANDILGDLNQDVAETAKNINTAITKLIAKGAKNIAIITLPDFSYMPAFNNKHLIAYKHFSPLKFDIKNKIINYNKRLTFYTTQHPEINLYLIDVYGFFNNLVLDYKNVTDPWLGTYVYPEADGYLWWDEFHPMTSVHERIAKYIEEVLTKNNVRLIA